MEDPPEIQCRQNWRRLDYAWERAHEQWHDRTAEFFFARFFHPLSRDTETFRREIEELMAALTKAQNEARGRW